jgi:hypothetical protein
MYFYSPSTIAISSSVRSSPYVQQLYLSPLCPYVQHLRGVGHLISRTGAGNLIFTYSPSTIAISSSVRSSPYVQHLRGVGHLNLSPRYWKFCTFVGYHWDKGACSLALAGRRRSQLLLCLTLELMYFYSPSTIAISSSVRLSSYVQHLRGVGHLISRRGVGHLISRRGVGHLNLSPKCWKSHLVSVKSLNSSFLIIPIINSLHGKEPFLISI